MTDSSGSGMASVIGSKSTSAALGGALLAFIGSFTTWASSPDQSVSGTFEGGDGWITLIVAVAAAAVAVFLKEKVRTISLIAGATILMSVAVADMLDINDKGLSIGFGLWLVLIGGLVVGAAAFWKA